jgi:hypothetical protein
MNVINLLTRCGLYQHDLEDCYCKPDANKKMAQPMLEVVTKSEVGLSAAWLLSTLLEDL